MLDVRFRELNMEFVGILWLGLLICAGISQNPFIYHPIYILCFSVPAFLCLRGAIRGRSKNKEGSFRIAIMNSMGTGSLIVVALMLLFFNVAFALAKSGIWSFR